MVISGFSFSDESYDSGYDDYCAHQDELANLSNSPGEPFLRLTEEIDEDISF